MFTKQTTRLYHNRLMRFAQAGRQKNSSIGGLFLFVCAIILSSLSYGQVAQVLKPDGGFHIDGDLSSNTPDGGKGDWVPGNSGAGGSVFSSTGIPEDPTKSFLVTDSYNSNTDDVFSGSALNDDPNLWRWTTGAAPSKNEIHRGMIHFSRDANGKIWIMMGADRLSTNGTAYIDFELLQSTLSKGANGTFISAGPHGGRTVNDLLITVLYNNGGGVSSIVYNRWTANASGGGYSYQPVPVPGPFGFAITNPVTVAVPFGAFGTNMYDRYQFVEAAVNLNDVIAYGSSDPCAGLNIKTIFIKTKASTSPTAALKDFINPLQVSYAVGNVSMDPVATVCINNSPVTLSGLPSGGVFSGPGVSGSSFDPALAGPGTHKIFYSKEIVPGCVRKDSTLVTVQALSLGGVVSGGLPVCFGANSGSLTLSGHNGDILGWQSSTDGTNYDDIANTSATQMFSNLTQTTYFRALVKNGVCASANSDPSMVTVNPVSVGGAIAGSNTVCYNANSGQLLLSGHTGSVVIWQQSVAGGSFQDIPGTAGSAIYAYANLTETTVFRAVIKSGVCSEENSSSATVTVDPASVGGVVAGGTTVCVTANNGTLTLSGQTGSVVKWQQSVSGGSFNDIANTASATYEFSNLTQTTVFRAVVKSGVCSASNSQPVTVTVDAASVSGNIIGGRSVCLSGNSGTLTIQGRVGDIMGWERNDNGSSWTAVDNSAGLSSINYSNLTQATQFRVIVKSGVCAAATSGPATITIDPISEGGSLAGNSHVCGGSNNGSIDLQGQTGDVKKWQKSENGGQSFSDIPNSAGITSFEYSNLTVTTIFRAVVQSGTCASANSSMAEIIVDPATVPGSIAGSVLICDNNPNSRLIVSGYTGQVITWQSSVDGSNWMDIDNASDTQQIGLLTQRTFYRVMVQSGFCPAMYTPNFTVMVMSCGPASNHCSYTQGFYGNAGGLGCSGSTIYGTTRENARTKMEKAFDIYGQSSVVFGRPDIAGVSDSDRAFTLFRADISNGNIFKMLPGGGSSLVLGLSRGGTAYSSTFEGATFSDLTTWNAVPIIPGGSNWGRIKNSLLAQTITLFFNMHNGTNLSYQQLHDTLIVADIDCTSGDVIPNAGMMKFGIPHQVLTYMENNNSVYTKDVNGLFKMANDLLGGVKLSGLNPSLVINAVDKINNAFDGCRALVGTYDIPAVGGTLIAIPYVDRSAVSEDNTIHVHTYPNPYRETISFQLLSKESGKGSLELYTLTGQRIATVFEGQLLAGSYKNISYRVPSGVKGMLTYVFQMGSKRAVGKLLSMAD